MKKHTKIYNLIVRYTYIFQDFWQGLVWISNSYDKLVKKYPKKVPIIIANIYALLIELGFKNVVDFLKNILF